MTGPVTFTMATKTNVFFCNPQSSRQPSSNENTKWLLRQRVLRGIELSAHCRANFRVAAKRLNARQSDVAT